MHFGGEETSARTYRDEAGIAAEAAMVVLSGRPMLELGGGLRIPVEGEAAIAPYAQLYTSWAPMTGNHFFLSTLAGPSVVTGMEIGYSLEVW